MKVTKSENYGRRSLTVGKSKESQGRLFLKQLIFYSALAIIVFLQLAAFSPAQSLSPTIEMVAVGDILLARGVEKRIIQFGADYPFENVKGILAGADLAFGNLENPLTNRCKKIAKKFSFQTKSEYSKILRDGGFDVLSLANNHSLDCGRTGLLETIESLKNENLRWTGAGKTNAEAESPLLIEIKGIKIAFLGFTAISPLKPPQKSLNIAPATFEKVALTVAAARQKADVVIVSFHWGTEYSSRPEAKQIEMANAAVKAGADVVLGHHPHVLQGFQLIDKSTEKRRAFVAFSLGNFVFDSPVRLNKNFAESVILKIRFGKKGLVSAEIIPVSIENFRPVIAGKEKTQFILTRVSCLSENFGTILNNGQLIIMPKTSRNLC